MILSIRNPKTGDKWTLRDLSEDTLVTDLYGMIASVTGIFEFELKCGFPPSIVTGNTLQDAKIRNGDQLLLLTASDGAMLRTAPLPEAKVNTTTAAPNNLDCVTVADGVILVREMKDDNSCLFRSIAYVLERDVEKHIKLRKVVADYIMEHPIDYPEVVLGKDPVEYCKWIQNPNSWGGAIELSIFSDYYKTEIASIDISTLRIDRFGQDKYDSRVIILYSGIHYDALVLSPSIGSSIEFDITCFSNVEILASALELAKKLKAKHKYTDLANFTLKCGICFQGLRGQVEAQKHAMSTGHAEFTEFQ